MKEINELDSMTAQDLQCVINNLNDMYDGSLDKDDTYRIAAYALQRRIPLAPILDDEPLTKNGFWDCLQCGCHFGDGNETHLWKYKLRYCPNCGQRIDWGDDQ